MAQPTAYTRQYSFTNYQAANPSLPLPGNRVDAELNAVKVTMDQVRVNLALIQNDDGSLKSEAVGLDQLADELEIGFQVPTAWATYTAYATSPASTVFYQGKFYRCTTAHSSTASFDSSKWTMIADLTTITLGSASQVAFTPTGGIAASDVQAALQELDTEKSATTHTHPATAISDSTTIGRTVLTAANAAAIRTALDVYATGATQPLSTNLTALGGVTSAADKVPYFTGSGTAAVTDLTAFGRSLVDDADAAAARTTLGLGTAAVAATGNSGATVPLLNGINTWSGTQQFSKPLKLSACVKASSDVTKISNTTLADVAGLSVTVESGKLYSIRVEAQVSCVAGGLKLAFSGTATATNFVASGSVVVASTALGGSQTSLGSAVVSGATGANGSGIVFLTAYLDCASGGTITVQFAQSASDASNSVVKAGSILHVTEIS